MKPRMPVVNRTVHIPGADIHIQGGDGEPILVSITAVPYEGGETTLIPMNRADTKIRGLDIVIHQVPRL